MKIIAPRRSEMPSAVSPKDIAASLAEHWSPRVVAAVDDSYVKVAKVKGTLAWHSHEHEEIRSLSRSVTFS